MLTEFHIGIDDTDSRLAGCTTYTAALLFQELASGGFKPLDFPWLVRLNPNVPWKTRGNGALSLHFAIEEEQLGEVKKVVLAIVERTTDLTQRATDPAVVFLKGRATNRLREFSARALHDVTTQKCTCSKGPGDSLEHWQVSEPTSTTITPSKSWHTGRVKILD